MTKKFTALAIADIIDRVIIEDTLLSAYIDPVYENGYDLSGEVVIVGTVKDNVDENVLGVILQDYLREYADIAHVTVVQLAPDNVRFMDEYRKAG